MKRKDRIGCGDRTIKGDVNNEISFLLFQTREVSRTYKPAAEIKNFSESCGKGSPIIAATWAKGMVLPAVVLVLPQLVASECVSPKKTFSRHESGASEQSGRPRNFRHNYSHDSSTDNACA